MKKWKEEKYKFRKLLGALLAACIVFASEMNVLAADKIGFEPIENMHADELVAYLNEVCPDWAKEETSASQFEQCMADCWNELKENDNIYVNEEGHLTLVIEETNRYAEFEKILDNWNLAIDIGILAIDEETLSLSMKEITDETLENVSVCYRNRTTFALPVMSPHCGRTLLDVGSLVSQNYDTISDFYTSMIVVSLLVPSSAWMETVVYWVGLVREGGAWDYKNVDTYAGKHFCCSYGDKKYQDHDAAWIGNYNYGYTGKILFDLSALHFGSSAVAGFDPKDKEEDWPAIDEGYYDAR